MSFLDLEASARAALPDYVAAYYGAAAGTGDCYREGLAEWEAVRFRPRVFNDLSRIDTSTTVLGQRVATPILAAPMAQQVAAHPDGERALGRAVAEAGSVLGVSTNTAVPFADIQATGAPWWYQVYVTSDHSLTEALVRRAVAHGATALMLTVDITAGLRAEIDPRFWPDGHGKARMTNLTADELAAAGPDALATDPTLDLATIGWLHEISGLPVAVKGVLRGDDADRCIQAGAAGIVVSTHGGRRVGASTTTTRALPEVVAAVDGRVDVIADSGIRSGEHVVAALALGAQAVFIGRPLLWGLAADGAAGAAQVLHSATADLQFAMTGLGVNSIAAIDTHLLA